MSYLRSAAIAATLMTIGTQAAAAPHQFSVNAVNDTVFEVIGPAGALGEYYWCAASHFARNSLGAGWTDRVEVVRKMGRGDTTQRNTAVQFTLSNTPNMGPLGGIMLINRFKPGTSMSVQAANGYCFVPQEIWEP